MMNISFLGDFLYLLVSLYFLIGLLWTCFVAYWIDQVPEDFLSTKQSILLLFILCIAWPVNLPVLISHGVKKTVFFEVF